MLTPERARELFKFRRKFNINLFLLDEAQITDDSSRGLIFDALVRRIHHTFTNASIVFAHPFVNNPNSQLIKHNLNNNSNAEAFSTATVGKIFIQHDVDKNKFSFFSPYREDDFYEIEYDIVENIIKNSGTLLVYLSKDKIVHDKIPDKFLKYINICPLINDPKAIALIEELRTYIGADEKSNEKHSDFIENMKYGIVLHHGSMPLKARFIIEEFIKANYAIICFATSTLNQGINMPFDVVWIDNFHNMDELTLKNLIGRSGRSTNIQSSFDYGYTIIKNTNVKTFSERINLNVTISTETELDSDSIYENDNEFEDKLDLIEAVKNETFNDDYNITQSQLDRIQQSDSDNMVKFILDKLLPDSNPITATQYYAITRKERDRIKLYFQELFKCHLRRKELTAAERNVLGASIPILLWRIQGKSFREMVSLRHSYLTQKDFRRELERKVKADDITFKEAQEKLKNTFVKYTPVPGSLPDKKLKKWQTFFKISIIDLNYDQLVYDTYDYIDKVISFSLSDPLCAVFMNFYNKKNDERALIMSNLIRYGTSDEKEIWLLKYGIDMEDIEWLKDYVTKVNANKIQFKKSIFKLGPEKLKRIERYL